MYNIGDERKRYSSNDIYVYIYISVPWGAVNQGICLVSFP